MSIKNFSIVFFFFYSWFFCFLALQNFLVHCKAFNVNIKGSNVIERALPWVFLLSILKVLWMRQNSAQQITAHTGIQMLGACPTLETPQVVGSSVHGISQARILEWVAISFFRGSSPPRNLTCISCVSCVAGRVLTLSHLGNQNMI